MLRLYPVLGFLILALLTPLAAQDTGITVPPGFKATVIADNLGHQPIHPIHPIIYVRDGRIFPNCPFSVKY